MSKIEIGDYSNWADITFTDGAILKIFIEYRDEEITFELIENVESKQEDETTEEVETPIESYETYAQRIAGGMKHYQCPKCKVIIDSSRMILAGGACPSEWCSWEGQLPAFIPSDVLLVDLQDTQTEVEAWRMIKVGFAVLMRNPNNAVLRIKLMEAEVRVKAGKELAAKLIKLLKERGIDVL